MSDTSNTIEDYRKDGWIPFIRKGRFRDMHGRMRHITDEVLDRIEANYRTRTETTMSPFCFGHPWDNQPAKGIIENVKRIGDRLLALPGKLANDTIEKLKSGQYKFVSAMLNDAMDQLQHIGFVPEPAIKGLGRVPASVYAGFSETDGGVLFSFEAAAIEPDESTTAEKIGKFFMQLLGTGTGSGIIDFIDDYNETKDNKIKSTGEDPGEEEITMKNNGQPPVNPPEVKPEAAELAPTVNTDAPAAEPEAVSFADFQVQQQRADRLEQEMAKLKQTMTVMSGKVKSDAVAFCETLQPGVIVKSQFPGVVGVLEALDQVGGSVQFAEGQEKEPGLVLRDFLKTLKPQVPIDPLPTGSPNVGSEGVAFENWDEDKEDLELANRAKQIMKEQGCGYKKALRLAEGGE